MKEPLSADLQRPQPAAEVKDDAGMILSENDPIAALAALYQGEKTDASYVFNTAMAMMGIAVAYLVGALQFIDKISQGPMAWLFLLLLPIPVWLIVAFHSLITLNAMTHGISVRLIEDALFDVSKLRVERELVGSAAGDKIMDISKSKMPHKMITAFVYGGVALLVVGFTAYALNSANENIMTNPHLVHAQVMWIALAIYFLVVVMVALSWFVGFKSLNEASALAKSYPHWAFRKDLPDLCSESKPCVFAEHDEVDPLRPSLETINIGPEANDSISQAIE